MVKKIAEVTLVLGLWVSLSGFMLGPPFRGSDALDALPPDATVVVGVTHVTTGDDAEKNDLFWKHTNAVVASLPSHQGYLGHKIRKQLFGNQAWTMTFWRDETSLNDFVRGDTHGAAIQNGLAAVEKGRFVRFTVERSKVPLSWGEVETIMNEKGRDLYGPR